MRATFIIYTLLLGVSLFAMEPGWGQSVRLKDITNIKGVRSNTLIGYGIVFGLAGTGDSAASLTTRQAASHMLQQLGVKANPDQLVSGNFAAVIATAELPPFARSGDRLDVRISANGDAKSLAGGTLLLTPLRAGDGHVYVVAQGPVVVGQAEGKGAEVLTVARVPEGGLVEREFAPPLAAEGLVSLSLKQADFTTSYRVTHAINSHLKGFYARSLDPVTIEVEVPPSYREDIVSFIAELENLRVEMERKAVVVLNERTGTVVMGKDVSIGPITLAHGYLSLQVNAAAKGKDKDKALMPISGPNVGDLVEALNQLGVKPKDLISILQAIHAAGALQGELKFM